MFVVMLIFLLDFVVEYYVYMCYCMLYNEGRVEDIIIIVGGSYVLYQVLYFGDVDCEVGNGNVDSDEKKKKSSYEDMFELKDFLGDLEVIEFVFKI